MFTKRVCFFAIFVTVLKICEVIHHDTCIKYVIIVVGNSKFVSSTVVDACSHAVLALLLRAIIVVSSQRSSLWLKKRKCAHMSSFNQH